MKKYIIFSAAIIGILTAGIAYAASYSQTSDFSHAFGSNAGTRLIYFSSSSIPSATGGTITQITFALEQFEADGTRWDNPTINTGCTLATTTGCTLSSATTFVTSTRLGDGRSPSYGNYARTYSLDTPIILSNDTIVTINNAFAFNMYGSPTSTFNGNGTPLEPAYYNSDGLYGGGTVYYNLVYSPAPKGVTLTAPANSSTLQNFQNWTIRINNYQTSTWTNGTDVGVWYARSTSSLAGAQPNQGNFINGLNVDIAGFLPDFLTATSSVCLSDTAQGAHCVVGDGVNNDGSVNFYISLPKFLRLTTGDWYAIPYLKGDDLTLGSAVHFVIDANAPLPAVSTSTNLQAGLSTLNTSQAALAQGFGQSVQTPVYTPTTSTTQFFHCLYSGISSTFNLWNGSDWQCLIFNTIDQAKDVVSNAASEGFNAAVGTASHIFPLSIIVGFNQDVSTAQAYAASTTLSPITLGNGSSSIFNGHIFMILNASSSAYIEEKMGWDYRGFATNLIYFLTAMALLGATVGIVRKMHTTPQS